MNRPKISRTIYSSDGRRRSPGAALLAKSLKSGPTMALDPRESAEDSDKIVALLAELQAIPLEDSTARKAKENEILILVDKHLREFLRGLLVREGGRARFTAMLHDFFIKVLEKRPDGFWKAQTAEQLRAFVSRALTRQMIDALRREKRYQAPPEGIDAFIDECRKFFTEKTGLEFSYQILERVNSWCQSDDLSKQRRGLILRHRYVDGMTRKQISNQLGITEHLVRIEHDAAIQQLKEEFDTQ
jgi:RNA polymerase sigma factor (sigma-70 family)